ncbi:glutamate--tRNA ligase [Blochmannia endosymbiont of Camponotus (Colobopsis) obliquus]|uniref:glutamate--tRNA ligase n=1 Tax=Blochmannia endosymbiont of Camponotus (Colobopsis) obliquus TaxID=1505597 RepID=UPI00061A8B43|nr:glutamate--tRNA ligase [Blochmannia endosymbiont of Camponotus (Colobopsis) obliquus]AKC60653.1 glutamate--tRNA ligase [Blochmannia endosymbiont of Camponotus (Colobopsis) obliquus]
MKIVRTRFAPSPTGNLHIGSMRTALYAWLFAKQQNGKFVLRIDDTDVERSTKKNVNFIIKTMDWLNIDWDEGPYFQSKRFDRYNTVIDNMLVEGKAYKCFCSRDRLEVLRKMQIDKGLKPRYDGYCRYLKQTKNSLINKSYVVRFCNPSNGQVVFYDQIRGLIIFDNRELDDLIIRRSDGVPTYNFCVVVDDIDMKITHVIRGEDHINNTPRQINIFKALNAWIPVYAHVSMVFDVYGRKLSKRHSGLDIIQYWNSGFLPEAMLNYLVRLGWSYGDQEIFNVNQMKKYFSFNSVSKSPSIFDIKKLIWLNHYYIKNLPVSYVASRLRYYLDKQGINISNGPKLIDIVRLFSSRCKTLKDMAVACHYCYQDFSLFNNKMAEKYLCLDAAQPLIFVCKQLISLTTWDKNTINEVLIETISILKIQKSKLGMPLRVAITGSNQSPDLTSIIYIIGRFRSLKRIHIALHYILSCK